VRSPIFSERVLHYGIVINHSVVKDALQLKWVFNLTFKNEKKKCIFMKLHHWDAYLSQYSDTTVKIIPLILIEILKEANLSVWVQTVAALTCF